MRGVWGRVRGLGVWGGGVSGLGGWMRGRGGAGGGGGGGDSGQAFDFRPRVVAGLILLSFLVLLLLLLP